MNEPKPREFYIVWDPNKTEGYITEREDEARYAAGLIDEDSVEGFGVSSIADDFRGSFDDCLEMLSIERLTLPPTALPPLPAQEGE